MNAQRLSQWCDNFIRIVYANSRSCPGCGCQLGYLGGHTDNASADASAYPLSGLRIGFGHDERREELRRNQPPMGYDTISSWFMRYR